MNQPKDKEFEISRSKCIFELNKIEKQFGSKIFRSACNRKLTVDRQTIQRQNQVKKMKKELEQLESGKPLPQY